MQGMAWLSVQILDLGDDGILPKGLKTVELAGLMLEDVYQDVSIIHCDPESVLSTYRTQMGKLFLFFDVVGHAVGDAGNMGGGIAFADDEILEGGLLKMPHVDDLDVMGLGLLQALDDGLN